VTIIASALDGSGNRLAGVPITFSTTAGTLSASSALSDANGEARVTLTTNREADVTARAGAQSATAKVTIAPAGTVTLTTSPANPLSGSPVTLTVAPATGTVPRVVIDWGDGATTDLGTVAGSRTVTHTYFRSGPYTITATSTSDDETFTTATSVTVASGASITLSAVSPTNPLAGSPITLTVTPAAGTAPRVVMDWGDGSSSDLNIVSSARGVAHTYSSAGSYIITATATAGGDTFSTSTAVTVAGRTISVNIADNRGGSPDRCQPVLFTANVTPASESITSYQWTIDSTVNTEDETVTTSGNALTRAFQNPGTKTISVLVTTVDGRTGNGQTQVVVKTTPATCP
jgi:adhesin/invasin